ncbi:MAG: type 1 glutamine amidotransferase/nicotinamidase-related amidase [Verrucomicrobiales bacterium]|jgi:type 1 glutamine amidotransferase/nicotinamidase-related amidase
MKTVAIAVFALVSCSVLTVHSKDFTLTATKSVKQDDGIWLKQQSAMHWQAERTAVIVCDMWDAHHCLNATKRGGDLMPRMNALLNKARSSGATIIHAPSSCMEFYKDHPARKRAIDTAAAPSIPNGIDQWLNWINDEEEKAGYPIDASDGGEDDEPAAHEAWAKELAERGRNPRAPWIRQAEGLEIDPQVDFITDDGVQNWNILHEKKIDNIILVGVHLNMCVLGRPFGLRQMTLSGKNVVLMRDLTDTMYNPKMPPHVSHFRGTDLTIDHVEKFVCPSVTSDQLLGGVPFHFEGDKRQHLVIVTGEKEYKTEITLPKFAEAELGNDFRISYVLGNEGETTLDGINVLADADVALISVRRRPLPADQLQVLREFAAAGKPMVGIRTASHAFSLRDKQPPTGLATWDDFDATVWGGNYHGHHGNQLKTVAWRVSSAAADNPLAQGIPDDKFATGGSLYEVLPLADGAEVVMIGSAETQDVHQPVAWTFTRKDGGRSFYTSLGHVDDFSTPQFKALLNNALRWAVAK